MRCCLGLGAALVVAVLWSVYGPGVGLCALLAAAAVVWLWRQHGPLLALAPVATGIGVAEMLLLGGR